jgi:hypothetical protein
MQGNSAQELYAQYENETLAVNQFATLHMGLQAGLTALKVDSYVIACAPYRLSLSGATLVAVFSREELVFFQRYAGALAGLALVFQPGNSPQPMKIFARCTIKTITPMKGKDSIGLIVLEWKPCPPDLQTIIGDFFMLVDRLKVEYEDFKGKRIAINAESAKLMGFNNYSLIKYEGAETKAALFALASDKLEFLVPVQAPPMEAGKPATVKLFFQSYQFSLAATVSEAAKLPNGAQKLALAAPFSAELVDIIEHYRFSERFTAKPAAAPGAPSEPNAGKA